MPYSHIWIWNQLVHVSLTKKIKKTPSNTWSCWHWSSQQPQKNRKKNNPLYNPILKSRQLTTVNLFLLSLYIFIHHFPSKQQTSPSWGTGPSVPSSPRRPRHSSCSLRGTPWTAPCRRRRRSSVSNGWTAAFAPGRWHAKGLRCSKYLKWHVKNI